MSDSKNKELGSVRAVWSVSGMHVFLKSKYNIAERSRIKESRVRAFNAKTKTSKLIHLSIDSITPHVSIDSGPIAPRRWNDSIKIIEIAATNRNASPSNKDRLKGASTCTPDSHIYQSHLKAQH